MRLLALTLSSFLAACTCTKVDCVDGTEIAFDSTLDVGTWQVTLAPGLSGATCGFEVFEDGHVVPLDLGPCEVLALTPNRLVLFGTAFPDGRTVTIDFGRVEDGVSASMSTQVETTKNAPNGPDCPPVCDTSTAQIEIPEALKRTLS